MHTELDFICNGCGELVYKARRGEFKASHICRTAEEREKAEKTKSTEVTFSERFVFRDWMPKGDIFVTDGTLENSKIFKII